jgi:hypothetical protein
MQRRDKSDGPDNSAVCFPPPSSPPFLRASLAIAGFSRPPRSDADQAYTHQCPPAQDRRSRSPQWLRSWAKCGPAPAALAPGRPAACPGPAIPCCPGPPVGWPAPTAGCPAPVGPFGCTACAFAAGFLFVCCSATADSGAKAKIDTKEMAIINFVDVVMIFTSPLHPTLTISE